MIAMFAVAFFLALAVYLALSFFIAKLAARLARLVSWRAGLCGDAGHGVLGLNSDGNYLSVLL